MVQRLQIPALSLVQSGVQMSVALLSARWLGPGDRGELVLATTIATLLLLVSSGGAGSAARVVLAEPGRWWTWPRHALLAATLTVPHLVLSGTVGLVLLSSLSSGDAALHVAFLVYSATALAAHLLREGLHGLGRHRSAIAIDVSAAGAQIALIAVVHARQDYSPVSALYIGSLCFAGVIAAQMLIGWRSDRPEGTGTPVTARVWWKHVWGLLLFSRLALVAALGQSFVVNGDRLLLGAFGDPEQVGFYSAASALAALAWVAPVALTALLTRRTAQLGSLDAWTRTRRPALALTGAIAVAVAVSGWFAIPLLLGDDFRPARRLLPILCAAAVPYASYHLDSAAVAGLRDLRTGATAALAGCLVLICAASIGYVVLDMYGVALGLFGTYATMAVIARRRLRRTLIDPVQHDV